MCDLCEGKLCVWERRRKWHQDLFWKTTPEGDDETHTGPLEICALCVYRLKADPDNETVGKECFLLLYIPHLSLLRSHRPSWLWSHCLFPLFTLGIFSVTIQPNTVHCHLLFSSLCLDWCYHKQWQTPGLLAVLMVIFYLNRDYIYMVKLYCKCNALRYAFCSFQHSH